MTSWRDVPWEYKDGQIFARINDAIVSVCYVLTPANEDNATLGRAIAHAWNMDLAQTQWARELFAVDDDSIGKVRTPAPTHPRR